jgi:hypothetical protein
MFKTQAFILSVAVPTKAKKEEQEKYSCFINNFHLLALCKESLWQNKDNRKIIITFSFSGVLVYLERSIYIYMIHNLFLYSMATKPVLFKNKKAARCILSLLPFNEAEKDKQVCFAL